MNSRDRDGELINAPKRKGKSAKQLVRAESFQAVTFYDPQQQRQVIVLYALGQDGVIREFGNNVWKPYPIEE